MDITEFINELKELQPLAETDMVEKAHNLLKNALNDFSFLKKKKLYQEAVDLARRTLDENAQADFIAAALLFNLPDHDADLYKKIRDELNEKIELIVRSYHYSHQRLNGDKDDLLQHSFRTALSLATIKTDAAAISAALLHEILFHTEISFDEVEKEFGAEVVGLIKNLDKIRSIKTAGNNQYVFHLREMVVAMAKDLRVVIIKMCSNIDRMKNPRAEQGEKIMPLALESREILAPLADLLGIWQLRWQLEDLSFKILQPDEYDKIARRFDVDEKKNRDKYIQKTKNLLLKKAKEYNIDCQVDGRFKHFYSIYAKMKDKKKNFDDIGDVFALRVVVGNLDDCYRTLGIIHSLWKPKQRRIKDYIADPKSNKYQSLHTTVFGVNGRATEFQIRTKEMDEEANYGISAHWYYKNPRKKVPAWINDLLIEQQQYKDDQEFLNKFTSNLLDTRIYVYSPKGDVISLPIGSTPLDFAYHVHTEIGHKCKEALVNDLRVPLNYELRTNDVVQIILDRSQPGPRREWLDFVKTHGAKKHIEDFLSRQPMERSFRL
ncbi:MAG: HD domain-containing protein [Patescibacteria group bacterium]